MENRIEVEDVVVLADRGGLPRFLLDNWQKRTGFDPVSIARDLVKRKRFVHYAAIALGFFITSGLLLIVGSLLTQPRANSVPLAVAGLVSVFLSCPLIFGVTRDTTGLNYPHEARGFEWVLQAFLEWGGLTVDQLAGKTEVELKETAERIVVDVAKQGRRLQQDNQDVPLAHWQKEKERREQEFENRYATCKNLGLVGGPYAKFYRKADVELGQRKPTGQID